MKLGIYIFLNTLFYSVLAESWAPIVTPTGNPIRVLPGRNVVLKARYENRQLLNCSLIPSHGGMVNLVAGYHLGQNLTYWGDGYDNGECGVLLLHLAFENSGHWTLVSEIENITKTDLINFDLQVYDSTPTLDRNDTQYLNENFPGEIILGLKDSNFCQGRLPDGTDLPFFAGQCRYKVNKANRTMTGKWTASYSTNSLMEFLQDEVEVVVNPSTEVIGYVESFIISHEYTNLICEYNSLNGENLNQIHYCYFISPNNEKIMVDEGMGNEDYIFYGKGLKGLKSKECGLTSFLKYEEIDKRNWTCVFGSFNGFETKGTIVFPPAIF